MKLLFSCNTGRYEMGGMMKKKYREPQYDVVDTYGNTVENFDSYEAANNWIFKNGDDSYTVEIVDKNDDYEMGGMMADGGELEADSNLEMLNSNIKEIEHHVSEMKMLLKKDIQIEAWVVAKAERCTTDLSDITHYLDGLTIPKSINRRNHAINYSDKLAMTYMRLIRSNYDNEINEKYQKLILDSKIPKDKLKKLEEIIYEHVTNRKGILKSTDFTQYW
jgi:hypothetical protein